MLVKPLGAPVPMERSREKITGVQEVPDTPYYRRRIVSGELTIVEPRPLRAVPPLAPKVAPAPSAPKEDKP